MAPDCPGRGPSSSPFPQHAFLDARPARSPVASAGGPPGPRAYSGAHACGGRPGSTAPRAHGRSGAWTARWPPHSPAPATRPDTGGVQRQGHPDGTPPRGRRAGDREARRRMCLLYAAPSSLRALPPPGFVAASAHGRLPLPVAQSVLHPPCVRALIGQGEAVGMAEQGRVGLSRQACALVIAADHAPDRRPDRAADAQLTAVHTKTPAERTATIADTVHHSIPLFH